MSDLLEWGKKTYVMGILNITPDSFSGDGVMASEDMMSRAVQQAAEFESAGADILDVGGESTRPGSQPVSAREEIDRVIPVIETLRSQCRILISIDTYKSSVAAAAITAGADWINDVWGLRADPEMAAVAAKAGCPIVLMHNRSKPNEVSLQEKLGGMYLGAEYIDLIQDVKRELLESVELGLDAGIRPDRIILDPGIGFGKTVKQNLELINRLNEIKSIGYPVLLGPSRKSFIGYVLDVPPEKRLEGTLAAISVGITRGADIIRVHDVAECVQVAKITDAITRIS